MITRVLVGGLIFKNGKILLLKRTETKKFLPGYYDLPGGKVEPGEDPNHALIREGELLTPKHCFGISFLFL